MLRVQTNCRHFAVNERLKTGVVVFRAYEAYIYRFRSALYLHIVPIAVDLIVKRIANRPLYFHKPVVVLAGSDEGVIHQYRLRVGAVARNLYAVGHGGDETCRKIAFCESFCANDIARVKTDRFFPLRLMQCRGSAFVVDGKYPARGVERRGDGCRYVKRNVLQTSDVYDFRKPGCRTDHRAGFGDSRICRLSAGAEQKHSKKKYTFHL